LLNKPIEKIAGAGSDPTPAIRIQNLPLPSGKELVYGTYTFFRTSHAPGRLLDQIPLNLRNIKLETVAEKAHCSIQMVSQVLCGVKNSRKVGRALAEMLGYATFEDLMTAAAMRRGGENTNSVRRGKYCILSRTITQRIKRRK
jgi:hypothetical protein